MRHNVFERLLVAVLVALVLVSSPASRAKETDALIAAYYPPLMITADGERPGISIEIVREAALRLGRGTTIEFLPFRRALKTLQHRGDALQPALYRLPKREPSYRWIAKTHDVVDVFLTLDRRIDSLEEARSLKLIGVETDASMDVFLTSQGFTNLERVDRPEVNAQKLAAGRIDAWALTRSLAFWTWRRAGHAGAPVAGAPIRSAPVYVVAGLGFPEDLVAAYSDAIEAMRSDGTIAAILQRYR
jgi:polar amino acid transport system substrate-binding protein